MNELRKYVKFICKVLDIEEPQVFMHQDGKFYNLKGKKIKPFCLLPTSAATTKDRDIYIDLDKCRDSIEYVFLAHELRHVYQMDSIKNNKQNEPIEEWEKAYESYQGSNEYHYEFNPLEIDANAFAYVVAVHLFNRPIWIKGPKKEINKKISILENKYGKILKI